MLCVNLPKGHGSSPRSLGRLSMIACHPISMSSLRKLEKFYVQLEGEPPIQLSCSYVGDSTPRGRDKVLIVYLNGLDNPHTMWYPMASRLLEVHSNKLPPMLMYDRPGQGTTKGRNPGIVGRPPGHGCDCLHAVHDLRELILKVADMRLGIPVRNINDLQIVFVASSLGCAIARIYAAEYPGTTAALLLLDSILANSGITSLFPDPSSPTFLEGALPDCVTQELCADARRKIAPVFDIRSPNKEGICEAIFRTSCLREFACPSRP